MWQSPNWPRPPDCFLCRPWPLAPLRIASRYGTRGGCVTTSTPKRRLRRSSVTSTCICERPSTSISPVRSSRRTSSVGSSSCRRRSDVPSFSSSPLRAGSTATDTTGAGSATGSTTTSRSWSSSRSPVCTSLSFATAPISPGPSSVTGWCSLPCTSSSAAKRSLPRVRVSISVRVARDVPGEDAEQAELAGERVGDGLEDEDDGAVLEVDLDLLAVGVPRVHAARRASATAGPRRSGRAARRCRSCGSRHRR